MNISWGDIEIIIKDKIESLKKLQVDAIYAIPRGGLVPGVLLSHKLYIPLLTSFDEVLLYKKADKKVLIVDEISDSGKTLEFYKKMTDFPIFTLYVRYNSTCIPDIYGEFIETDEWLNFPW
jgi:uncharacterized protein